MWIDCNSVFINLDKVDYISFEECDNMHKATVFFENGGALNFEHSDLDTLKNYFNKVFKDE